MGVGEALVISAAAGVVGSAWSAHKTSKAIKGAAKTAAQGPAIGRREYMALEEYLGGAPTIPEGAYVPSKYYSLEGGDYDALERSLYERETGMWEPDFQDALRMIDEEMARRGFGSTIDDEARYRLATNLAERLRTSAAGATATRYGLQRQDLASRSAFEQAEAGRRTAFNLSPIDLWFKRAQLGVGSMGMGVDLGTSLADLQVSGQQLQNQIVGGVSGGLGELASSYAIYKALIG